MSRDYQLIVENKPIKHDRYVLEKKIHGQNSNKPIKCYLPACDEKFLNYA